MFRQLQQVTKIHRIYTQSMSTATKCGSQKVAVILSGCGVFDGTEIHEASATAVHLTRRGLEPVFFAPKIQQMHVIDHSKGQEASEKRCVFSESARIARGAIQPISDLKADIYAAVVFPGGFGAAKNLSTFATAGADCTVNADVTRVFQDFHKAKKPIALMCIAPIIAAKLLPKVKITLGQKNSSQWPHSGAIDAATQLGANVELKNVNEVAIDKENLVLTTPAFMYEGKFNEIFDGIGNLIDTLHEFIKTN